MTRKKLTHSSFTHPQAAKTGSYKHSAPTVSTVGALYCFYERKDMQRTIKPERSL